MVSNELTPEQRRLRAQIAAHVSWANTQDRAARTAAARKAAVDRFHKQVDPEGKLSPQERAVKLSLPTAIVVMTIDHARPGARSASCMWP
ncbi:hypothetical protein FHX82_006466 [Amycolatopsis bartoniae]|uniref:Uncharacterized protein n=1 Tax=Amycolatopsis bartoniae TaxID=941986 RepID=A0A8H9IZV6_9PSEU|nr:hypothetical protein [Amycolatopsis bartoniae]MBB2939380.1 hypothetical protein [Amycolatopsis bartoniae]TVT06699.1 hypothetical protein FNH07_19005 [Amycolatopsis bartoniae]GHF83441.1 hypothetical protein GCM10017566_66880 [Amycolatopsis bartoniae]